MIFPLTAAASGAYNTANPRNDGEHVSFPPVFQRARGRCKRVRPKRKYRLPTGGGPRPLQRRIEGPGKIQPGNKGGTAGEEKAKKTLHARPFIVT